jgi:hypothetical protein
LTKRPGSSSGKSSHTGLPLSHPLGTSPGSKKGRDDPVRSSRFLLGAIVAGKSASLLGTQANQKCHPSSEQPLVHHRNFGYTTVADVDHGESTVGAGLRISQDDFLVAVNDSSAAALSTSRTSSELSRAVSRIDSTMVRDAAVRSWKCWSASHWPRTSVRMLIV